MTTGTWTALVVTPWWAPVGAAHATHAVRPQLARSSVPWLVCTHCRRPGLTCVAWAGRMRSGTDSSDPDALGRRDSSRRPTSSQRGRASGPPFAAEALHSSDGGRSSAGSDGVEPGMVASQSALLPCCFVPMTRLVLTVWLAVGACAVSASTVAKTFPNWAPDDSTDECTACTEPFTFFRRKQ